MVKPKRQPEPMQAADSCPRTPTNKPPPDPQSWIRACAADLSANPDGRPSAAISKAVASCFPAEWRAPNVFSASKADLLKQLYGDRWFDEYWSIPGAVWLPPADFRRFWTKSDDCKKRVVANVRFWSSSPVCAGRLSALDWHRILQACVDFDLPRAWFVAYRSALAASSSWSANERALLLFTY
jgi:hypothetical protein